MIARAYRLRPTFVFYFLAICVALATRPVVSPSDIEAPGSHKPAQSLDSPSHAAINLSENTNANNAESYHHATGAEAAESLTSSSDVWAEAVDEPIIASTPLYHPVPVDEQSIELSKLVEAPGDLHAPSLPGEASGLGADVASTLVGHVVNVSSQAGNHSSSDQEVSQVAKPEQPPQAQISAKKPEEDEERHNFALAKDGAKIVAANKEARKPESVLDSDGDTFLKNECKADKWLIMELSQVTKIDMIRLSQDELYSSRIRDFEVFGRQNHPRVEGPDYGSHLNASAWQLLGSFTAANTKGTQAFHVDPPGWAKYVQLRLRTHYGSEPVCALNDVRVYGKSAAEDLEDRLAMEAAADDEAAAQEECSADEGNAQESRLEPRQQSGPGDAEGIQQQSSEADADRDAEDVRPKQALSVPSDKLPKDELGQTEPKEGGKALGAEHNSEASAQSSESKELSDAIQVLPVSGGPKAAIPPVLDLLGESLKRLIVPAGAGKKRSAYSGEPANPQALPEPDSGMPVPEGDRPEQKVAAPAKGSMHQVEGAHLSAEPGSTAVVRSDDVSAKPTSESAASGDHGSRKQDEAGGASNGSKRLQREDRSADKDGDLLLAGSSAGSAKSRHGGSVYDLLVAEIKALKLQQKTAPRVLSDMQKNVTLAIAAIATEVSALHRRVSEIEDSSTIPSPTCAAALPGSRDGQLRVYPNSTAEPDTQNTLAHADGRSGPVTVSFDAMALALELAALRSAGERASRREFALVMVIVMLCAILALSLPQLAAQSAWLRSVILLLAVANGFFGILLHFANSLQPEKSMFMHMHRLLGA